MGVCVCSCDEDVVIMIARLETMFFFDREHHSFEKLSRMAFMVLHKLAILAQHVRHTHTHTHTRSGHARCSQPETFHTKINLCVKQTC